jgi:hypothetical protein
MEMAALSVRLAFHCIFNFSSDGLQPILIDSYRLLTGFLPQNNRSDITFL